MCAITVSGPHIVPGELAAAWALARRLGVRHLVRSFDPLTIADFQGNTRRRCYACKRAIIEQAWQVAREQGAEVLWDGTNLDDLGDFRPGLEAAQELGVTSPLLAAGLDKAAIRTLSRAYNLPVKPPQSCLATRFPYGTSLSREALERVGQGEAWLRRRGFFQAAPAGAGGRRRPPGTGPGGVGGLPGPGTAGAVYRAAAAPGLRRVLPGFASLRW